MIIHAIGDSHSSVFSGQESIQPIYPERSNDILDNFRSYRIGPATAYNLNNKVSIIENIIENCVDTENDYLLFCFGEIDVRAHLCKMIYTESADMEETVSDCVNKYTDTIKHFLQYTNNIIVWGVIPSWSDKKPLTTAPTFGTNVERNIVTKKFNTLLKTFCDENNLGYVDIFDELVNDDLTTKEDYLDDWEGCHIHLKQNCLPIILEKFKIYIND